MGTLVFEVRPLRGGAERGSARRCGDELDLPFFSSREKRAGGGASVTLRGGVQLATPKKVKEKDRKPRRKRGNETSPRDCPPAVPPTSWLTVSDWSLTDWSLTGA